MSSKMKSGAVLSTAWWFIVLLTAVCVYHLYHHGQPWIGLAAKPFVEPMAKPVVKPVAKHATKVNKFPKLREQWRDKTCSAFFALRRINPSLSEAAPGPFELLGLDYSKPPLAPPEDSAYPGAPSNEAVKNALLEAARSKRASLWSQSDISHSAKRVIDATWFVSELLHDDQLRLWFLKELQPLLEKQEPAGWLKSQRMERPSEIIDGLCEDWWLEKGWVLL